MDTTKKAPGNYLAIDGGRGGLFALCAIEELCSRIQFDINSDDEQLPCRLFDVIGGTDEGALVAILLGRMGMSPSQAIQAYSKLIPALRVEPANSDDERKANSVAFETAFSQVLEEAGLKPDTLMLDASSPKTVLFTSSITNLSIYLPIRSYRVRGAPPAPCTILQAACASVASQDRFNPVTIGSEHKKMVLVDAMVACANPTKELLREAQQIFGREGDVATIVSIGSGKEVLSVKEELGKFTGLIKRAILGREQVHEDLQGRLRETGVYFRFNVEVEVSGQSEDTTVQTSVYFQGVTVSDKLDEAIKSIQHRPAGVKLKDINSISIVEIKLKPRPALAQNFIGRDNILEDMRKDHFGERLSESYKPTTTVLSGLGGSGKTQIALKFALDFEEKFPEAAVYFLNASSKDKLKADFETLIRSRGLSHRSDSLDEALVWLAVQQKRWLLILDNADDPSIRIFPFIPRSSYGSVIITTRNSTLAILAPNNSHHVEGLSKSESVALLLAVSGYENKEDNRNLAEPIVEAIGRLPLALSHAGAYIRIHQCLPTYLTMYQEHRSDFLASEHPELPDNYRPSVAVTIQMSLNSLSQGARDLLRLFGCLDVSSIPHEIVAIAAVRRFQRVPGTYDSDRIPQTLEQASALMKVFCPKGEWSEYDFNELILQCLQYSLLRVTTQGDARYYSMHVLVQSYLQADAGLLEKHRPDSLVIRLLGSSITLGERYEFLAFNRLLSSHLKMIRIGDVIEPGDHLGFGDVLNETGDDMKSLIHRERCVEMWRASLGEEAEDTMTAMDRLAGCYREVGQGQKAMELYEQLLKTNKRLHGAEHRSSLMYMGNLVAVYLGVGRNDEAVELGEKLLKLMQLQGMDQLDTLLAMNNLALAYSELGKSRQAQEMTEQLVELRRKISGPEHPDTLLAVANLAKFHSEVGNNQEALELTRQVLEARTRLLGPEHPSTITAMNNLSVYYSDAGNSQQAMDLTASALEMLQRTLGPLHPLTLDSMLNLARFSSELGRYQDALDLNEKALEMLRKVLGPEHQRTLLCMGNLAKFYSDVGNNQKALEITEKVLEMRKRTLGPEHSDTLRATLNISVYYSDLGMYQQALDLGKQVLEESRRILGPEHRITLLAMGNLAKFYSEIGRSAEAVQTTIEVLEIRKQLLGPEHPDTIMALASLPKFYAEIGDSEKAMEIGIQAMEMCNTVLGPEHRLTLLAMGNQAKFYFEAGRIQESLEMELRVLEDRKSFLGSEHPDTLMAMGNLAVTYIEIGKDQDAMELLEQVVEIRIGDLGLEHLSTLDAMWNLLIIVGRLGMEERAKDLAHTALPAYEAVLGMDHPRAVAIREALVEFSDKEEKLGDPGSTITLLEGVEKPETQDKATDSESPSKLPKTMEKESDLDPSVNSG